MPKAWFACVDCSRTHDLQELYRCPDCSGELAIDFDLDRVKDATKFLDSWHTPRPFWDRFGAVLPLSDRREAVTAGEGNTPLVRSGRFAEKYGLSNLHFKLESANPTGSFKDRQVTVALSQARTWGRTAFATVSSGNVGVALSAYTARAGGDAYVWVAEGTAESKVLQIQVYGAQVFLLPDPGEQSARDYFATYLGLQDFCAEHGLVPMISARPVNPYMVEGSKTISYELAAELGRTPDIVFGPVGGGGMLGGVWKGFTEMRQLGLSRDVPQLWAGQPGGHHAPIDRLTDPACDWSEHYRPLDGAWAWQSIRESGGRRHEVSDADILHAQAELAALDGIFAEPQGAYAAAALIKAAQAG
ncbi:MAG TPA: pyridoxal-phosphate dependent enzyme, partial [Deinococcales bacterium]|nr:pyridoxal-phosphate dependent enzyme [Deinococcales bacterium]